MEECIDMWTVQKVWVVCVRTLQFSALVPTFRMRGSMPLLPHTCCFIKHQGSLYRAVL